jgi:hypothetical protein
MRLRVVALAALVLFVAACSPGAHWVGDGVQAVDGFWVQQERTCADPGCVAAKDAALVVIGDPDGLTVTAVSQADWTEAYDTGIGGGVILRTTSGAVGITFFVLLLELDDGTRHVVPIACTQQSGVAPPAMWDHCGPDPSDHWYNGVGHEPWTQPRPNSL